MNTIEHSLPVEAHHAPRGFRYLLDSLLACAGSLLVTGIIYAFHLYPRIPNISVVYLLVVLALAQAQYRQGAFQEAADLFNKLLQNTAPTTTLLPLVPGLPDEAYDHDGALTKRHVRAATLAVLAPTPGALLWDVGAGSGSISIEWLRAEPTARAIAIEPREDRATRIELNARRLGVPSVEVVRGRAPGALEGLNQPDAVFVGGGLTAAGLLERCWAALPAGGRIVANAVTLEGEHELVAACGEHGGALARIEICHAEPIGGFTGWRAQMPVVQWAAGKDVP